MWQGAHHESVAHRPAVADPPRRARMAAYGNTSTWRQARWRAFAFQRIVQFGLGHFDHDFLTNYELKYIEE